MDKQSKHHAKMQEDFSYFNPQAKLKDKVKSHGKDKSKKYSGKSSCCPPEHCRPKCCICPPGATGATGPQGPQGPQGFTGIPEGFFGNGSDGNIDLCAVLNGTAVLPSNGPIERRNYEFVLTRDAHFLTLNVCGKLNTKGYRIFARQLLELISPNAENQAIICNNGCDGTHTCGGPGALGATCGRGTNGGFDGPGESSTNPNIGGQGGSGMYAGGLLFPFSSDGGGPGNLNVFPENTRLQDLNGLRYWGGTGGGGSINVGGGGGGGIVLISALNIGGKGTIQALGGNGYPVGETGGGGGGAIVLNYVNYIKNVDMRSLVNENTSIGDIYFDISGGNGSQSQFDGADGAIYIVKV